MKNKEIKFRVWGIDGIKPIQIYDWDYVKVVFYDWLCDERTIVMQYTGLKDKNGKEVYEGDIIKHDDELFICELELTSLGYMYSFTGKFKNQLGDMTNWQLGGASMNDIEVIGNIYETPELKRLCQ